MVDQLTKRQHSSPWHTKILSLFLWKNHLLFEVVPPVRGPTGTGAEHSGGVKLLVSVAVMHAMHSVTSVPVHRGLVTVCMCTQGPDSNIKSNSTFTTSTFAEIAPCKQHTVETVHSLMSNKEDKGEQKNYLEHPSTHF